MANLFVAFAVTVSDSKYYGSKQGGAETVIQVPRAVLLEGIDLGQLFTMTLQAALADFDAVQDEEEGEP